jgi:hypothetical protein
MAASIKKRICITNFIQNLDVNFLEKVAFQEAL